MPCCLYLPGGSISGFYLNCPTGLGRSLRWRDPLWSIEKLAGAVRAFTCFDSWRWGRPRPWIAASTLQFVFMYRMFLLFIRSAPRPNPVHPSNRSFTSKLSIGSCSPAKSKERFKSTDLITWGILPFTAIFCGLFPWSCLDEATKIIMVRKDANASV